jgi:anti-sigma factor RsiW
VTQADRVVEPALQPAGLDAPHRAVGVAEVTHGTVRDLLSDYLGGTLDSSEQRRVLGHLAQCRGCSAYLTTLRKTVDLVGQLPARPAPADVKARILEQARTLEQARPAQPPPT